MGTPWLLQPQNHRLPDVHVKSQQVSSRGRLSFQRAFVKFLCSREVKKMFWTVRVGFHWFQYCFFFFFFFVFSFLFVFLQKLETDKAKMPIRSLKWLIYLIFYTFQKNRDLSHCPMLFLHPSHVFLALKHESKQIKNNFVWKMYKPCKFLHWYCKEGNSAQRATLSLRGFTTWTLTVWLVTTTYHTWSNAHHLQCMDDKMFEVLMQYNLVT